MIKYICKFNQKSILNISGRQNSDIPNLDLYSKVVESMSNSSDKVFLSNRQIDKQIGWIIEPQSDFWVNVHMTQDMPYLAIFAGLGLLVRVCFVPLSIYTSNYTYSLIKYQPDFERILFLVNNSDLSPKDKLFKLAYLSQLLCKSKDTKIFRFAVLPNLIFIPLFIIHIWTVRKIISKSGDVMQNSGILWFPDLSIFDPMSILPLLNQSLLVYQLNRGIEVSNAHYISSKIRSVWIGQFSCMVPAFLFFPAGVFVYWLPGTIFMLIYNVFIQRYVILRYNKKILEKQQHDQINMHNQNQIDNKVQYILNLRQRDMQVELNGQLNIVRKNQFIYYENMIKLFNRK